MTTPETATKWVRIAAPAEHVFAFVADPANLPRWAVHNVRAARPAADGWWELETPRGPARFRMRAVPAHGLLDHDFVDAAEGRWTVHARVVPATSGDSVYAMTFVKPDPMPVDAFRAGMALMDDELAALKRAVEAGREMPA